MNGIELKELLDTVSEKVRKETAKEIRNYLMNSFYLSDSNKYFVDKWLKEQYEVEVEE